MVQCQGPPPGHQRGPLPGLQRPLPTHAIPVLTHRVCYYQGSGLLPDIAVPHRGSEGGHLPVISATCLRTRYAMSGTDVRSGGTRHGSGAATGDGGAGAQRWAAASVARGSEAGVVVEKQEGRRSKHTYWHTCSGGSGQRESV
eukprot:3676697-Rhodomonas_salina.1